MTLSDSVFYASVPISDNFLSLSDPAQFTPLPETWVLGVADIVDSTGEIAQGRYKTVNMVGAAVISGMINAVGGKLFPYIFGGDGAFSAADRPDMVDDRAPADTARPSFPITGPGRVLMERAFDDLVQPLQHGLCPQ